MSSTISRKPRLGLTPGLAFLLQNSPTILGPSLFVYTLAKLTNRYQTTLKLPSALGSSRLISAAAYIIAFPIWFFIKVTWRDIRDKIEAEKLGAVLLPRVRDWTPGSLKNMKSGVENIKNGYPGDFLRDWMGVYGNAFNFRFLFDNRVCGGGFWFFFADV